MFYKFLTLTLTRAQTAAPEQLRQNVLFRGVPVLSSELCFIQSLRPVILNLGLVSKFQGVHKCFDDF